MSQLESKVFLQFESNQRTWKVSEEYRGAAEKHIENVPTTFYLPWPENLIPAVGEKFWFSNMVDPNDQLVVKEVEYGYSSKSGIKVYVTIEPVRAALELFNEYNLIFAGEEGFLFEDMTPIKSAFKAAGLPTTSDELKQRRGEK